MGYLEKLHSKVSPFYSAHRGQEDFEGGHLEREAETQREIVAGLDSVDSGKLCARSRDIEKRSLGRVTA